MKIFYHRFFLSLLIQLSFLTTYSSLTNTASNNLAGITISGNVIRDGNGLVDSRISGTGTGNTNGIQLIAYLVNASNNIIDKTNVLAGGSYAFNQVANGSYIVAISTNDVPLGLTLATIPANIPAGWNAVGESYGLGNSQIGFEMGVSNLQIAVNVINSNQNILSVNFALDQSPIVSNDFFTTTINTNFDIPVLANDTDPNGNSTIDETTVLLIDPADNVKKSTVTIIGQGIYTVNPVTGTVNFNPLAIFIGVATQIRYTVKDDAGIESNEGLLSVLVKPVGVNDAGRTPNDEPIITIVKANDGNSAIGTTVSIAVPPATGSVVVNPDGSITYTPIPGDKGTYTYTYLLTTVDGVTSDPITVTVAVRVNPTIALLKTNTFNDTNGDGAAQVGETITYTFTVTNTGDVPVTATNITDSKVNFLNVALVPANLAPGQTGTLTAVYTITQADVNAGSVTNTAIATAKDPIDLPVTDVSGTTNNNNTPTVIVVSQNPSIALLKTSVFNDTNGDGFPQVGETITYNFTVTNTGNVTVTGANITDLKVNLVNAPINPANLEPRQTGILSAIYILTQADVDAGSVSNTAIATATDPKNQPVTDLSGTTNNNNTPTVIVVTQNPAIALVKTSVFNDTNADGFAQVGETVTYTFNVTNTGNVSVTGANITDPKVNLVNAPIAPANLAPGQTGTLFTIYILTQADINAGSVSNIATATATDPKNQLVTDVSGTNNNNNSPTVTTITKNPSISLLKTGVFNDLNGDGFPQVGETITYTFTVTNTGNVSVTSTTITDPKINVVNTSIIPSNLAPGQTGNLIAVYTLKQEDINATSVTNTATARALDPSNNPVTDISGTDNNNNTPTIIVIGQSPPIAVDDVVPMKQNQTTIIEVLKNDRVGSSNFVPGSVVIKTLPAHGTATVNANGTVTYTPNLGYIGNDIFTYTVNDASGMTSNIATVTIIVGKTTPLAVDDNAKTDINKNVKVNVIDNDVEDNSPFVLSTIQIITQPINGIVTNNGDGTFTYTPNPDYAGNDEFTYNVADANGSVTNTATVKIVVSGFFVPNVFTPNGDGVNDTFEIVGKDNYTAVELEIFNRWGNQVYKNTNYQNQWIAQGLNEGTYFYTIKLNSSSESKFVKGWVLIKR